ncbi:MAG: TonB-dependent receptor [Proteobacteria bacterium]|nr:TonB-dependent receptor [Pseudomonadota bacterium]
MRRTVNLFDEPGSTAISNQVILLGSVHRLFLIGLCCVAWTTSAVANDTFTGRSVSGVLEQYRSEGWSFVYSSNLINQSMLVRAEPESIDPEGIVREILIPHDLTLLHIDELYLVVRTEDGLAHANQGSLLLIIKNVPPTARIEALSVTASVPLPEPLALGNGLLKFNNLNIGDIEITISLPGFVTEQRTVRIKPGHVSVVLAEPAPSLWEFDKVTVTTSRYQLQRELSASVFHINQRAIQSMPDLGDDPIRSVQRLPGAAAGGISAKTHFRGGADDEVAIILNGHRLLDPFHVRNFQNIFSAVDVRAISGIEVYTGGFPVRYGDRMSGLILIETMKPERLRQTEIGFSAYNTSFLSAGSFSTGSFDWLVSARRGNLDLVVNKEFGEPDYSDFFFELAGELSPKTTLSLNILLASDRVLIVTDDKVDEQERSDSRADNSQFWLRLKNEWSDDLSSTTVLSFDTIHHDRMGLVIDPEAIVGFVDDRRETEIVTLRQDWQWFVHGSYLLQWGIEAQHAEADYRYRSAVDYFGIDAVFSGLPVAISRDLAVTVDGDTFAAYLSNRWRLGSRAIMELGFRWDKQTFQDTNPDSQFSPRLSFLYTLNPKTDLRLSWGRYYQFQGIQELQVEDGVNRFSPAQRADQLIIGIQHRFGNSYLLRAEAFNKSMERLKPRFENLFDSLSILPELQSDRVRIDPEKARARGVELYLEKMSGGLRWWGAYSFSKVEDQVNGGNVARGWDQRHALQAGFSWRPGDWQLDLAAGVHTGWPKTDLVLSIDSSGEPVVTPGPRNAERFARFTSVDIRASRKFKLAKGTLSAFFELTNALNRRNPCCSDFDLEEDSAGVAFLEKNEDDWLPLLPGLGFLYEF